MQCKWRKCFYQGWDEDGGGSGNDHVGSVVVMLMAVTVGGVMEVKMAKTVVMHCECDVVGM